MKGFAVALALAILLARMASGKGQAGNANPATQWCDLAQAERDCICNLLPCYPKKVQDALNNLKGTPGNPGKPWKSAGSICKQELAANPGGGGVFGRTLHDQGSGKVEGVAFPPAFSAGTGAEHLMWKKVAVRQEANRVFYGDQAPSPYQGVTLGSPGFTTAEILEIGCWKAAYQGVNQGFAEARDAQSRSSMIDMAPPAGVAAADWKDHLCKKVIPAAQTALDNAKKAKAKAKKDAAGKKAQGPGNDPNATKAKLNDWIRKLCKEIAAAQAALDKAKEHCK